MIDGSTTRLREPRPSDLPALALLRNDLALQRLLLAHARPNSLDRVGEWVSRVSSAPDSVFFVVADLDDAPLGFVQVTAIDLIDGHGQLGIALADSSRGGGHGREAVELLVSYLRSVFNLRKLVLEVAVSNEAAVALYARVGFRQVGVLEAHVLQDGVPVDVAIMELLFTS